MLNKSVFLNLDKLARTFVSNDPFRYVVIENFFHSDVADSLLADFPAFRPENARNEMGKTGRKAVVQDLPGISPFYGRVADYLAGDEFLDTMSSLTGIPGLKYDHQMFGGGTHENLHGQELDPHVDFNILDETGWHRRLNIIVYLNTYWAEKWGGAIELHSNPRAPEQNRITSFSPVFNRAIIFETNEYSWHGFPRINLPEADRSRSRKSLSIYLYTQDRPKEEKAPSHGTFYVPRPLPAHIEADYILDNSDVHEIRQLLGKRDQLLAFHQKKDLEDSTRYSALRDQFHELQQALALPLLGFVRQVGSVQGYFADGNVAQEVKAQLHFARPAKRLTLRAYLPEHLPKPVEITVTAGKSVKKAHIRRAKNFYISLPCSQGQGDHISLTINSSVSISGKTAGINEDVRELSFLLKEIVAE